MSSRSAQDSSKLLFEREKEKQSGLKCGSLCAGFVKGEPGVSLVSPRDGASDPYDASLSLLFTISESLLGMPSRQPLGDHPAAKAASV